MSTLSIHSNNEQILAVYGKALEAGNPIIYSVEKATEKTVQLGIIQKLKDVPSRGNTASNSTFSFSNALADDLGINTANNIYRNLTLVTNEVAEKAGLKVGLELKGFSLEIEDKSEPWYEGQTARFSKINGELVERTSGGFPVYTNTTLKRANEITHKVMKFDPIENKPQAKKATVADLKSEFSNNLF